MASLLYYFRSHNRFLLWPSLFFLIGATYPSRLLIYSAAVLLLFSLIEKSFHRLGKRLCRGEWTDVVGSFLIPVTVFLIAGGFIGMMWQRVIEEARYLSEREGTRTVQVMMLDNPVGTAYGWEFTAEILAILPSRGEVPLNGAYIVGKKAVVTSAETKSVPGDILIINGEFDLPRQALNPMEFNWRDYLIHRGVFLYFNVYGAPSQVEALRPGAGLLLKRFSVKWLSTARRAIAARIDSVLPENESAIFKSVLLGEKTYINADQELVFKRAGLYRLLGTTGFQIEFVATIWERLLRKVLKNKRLSQIISCFVALFYFLLAGFSAGSLRGLIFYLSKTIAPACLRKHDALQALSIAGIISGFIIPFPLLDTGFQLSFSAVLGSLIGYHLTRTIMGGSIGLVAAILPLLIYYFDEVSLTGLFLAGFWNLVTAILLASSAIILAVPQEWNLLGWVPFLLARGAEFAGEITARLPFASVAVCRPAAYQVMLFYLLMGLIVVGKFGGGRSRSVSRALVPLTFATIALTGFFRFYPIWPEITFLSVGQGDSTVIRFRDKVVLIDTGTQAAFENTVAPYLRRLGIREIDLLILSHMHQDHAGGLSTLSILMKDNVLRVRAIMSPLSTCQEISETLFGEDLRSSRVQIIEAHSGDTYSLMNMFCHVLWSGEIFGEEDENENSIVTDIYFKDLPFLFEFWGDSPQSVISSLTPGLSEIRGSREHIVVKVPHHGSVYSLAEGFYDDLRGQHAVISVGPNNYGHPSPLVMYTAQEKGAIIWRTDKQGAITVRTALGKFKVSAFVRN